MNTLSSLLTHQQSVFWELEKAVHASINRGEDYYDFVSYRSHTIFQRRDSLSFPSIPSSIHCTKAFSMYQMKETSLHPYPTGNSFVHTGNALLYNQLPKPQLMHELTEKVLSNFEETMRWVAFFEPASCPLLLIRKWCCSIAGAEMYFLELKAPPFSVATFESWNPACH